MAGIIKEEEHEYIFPWLEDELYQEYIGEFKRKVGQLMGVFNCYGLDVFFPGFLNQVVHAAEDLCMKIRGDEREIAPRLLPLPRPTGNED
jgi:hypothetical protein